MWPSSTAERKLSLKPSLRRGRRTAPSRMSIITTEWGAGGDLVTKLLGGAVGLGLKKSALFLPGNTPETRNFEADVRSVAGRGPAVIVMSEMPGISPEVARFARWVRDAGFAVYMPSLFGRDGAVPRTEEGVAVFSYSSKLPNRLIASNFGLVILSPAWPSLRWRFTNELSSIYLPL
jgi:Dienelactone hydrolase family